MYEWHKQIQIIVDELHSCMKRVMRKQNVDFISFSLYN